jgi:hypothetical protein
MIFLRGVQSPRFLYLSIPGTRVRKLRQIRQTNWWPDGRIPDQRMLDRAGTGNELGRSAAPIGFGGFAVLPSQGGL